MPLYELKCPNCLRIYEITMTLNEKDNYDNGNIYKKCPNCKYKLKPILSKPMFRISI